MTEATVAIDEYLTAEAAYIEPERWNGFAVPYFTQAEGLAMIPTIAAECERFPDTERLDWDDARGVFTLTAPAGVYGPDAEVADVPTIERDGVTLHGIGAGAWVWTIVPQEEA